MRPIDLHLKSFKALGADIDLQGGFVYAQAPQKRLTGATIYMDQVSVGATINAILASVLANGLTVIENAAKEPHIVDVANFLNSMGANIMAPAPTSSRFTAWTSCTAPTTPSSPTRSRLAPT